MIFVFGKWCLALLIVFGVFFLVFDLNVNPGKVI